MCDLKEVLDAHLPYLLGFAWVFAITVYGMKLIFPRWDVFTRFGKLESEPTVVPGISSHIGWISFYSFSCTMYLMLFLTPFPPSLANHLLVAHSFRRLLESLCLTKFTKRKMHVINLFAGWTFYGMAPLSLAYCSGHPLFSGTPVFPAVVLAIVLNAVQFMAHRELASLKKYSIPRGALFELTASPHYAVEIMLYLLYFLSAPHFLTVLMLVFVAFNLTHQCIMTYEWYVTTFSADFTKLHRSVLFPFVY
jgi:hypothetical protein